MSQPRQAQFKREQNQALDLVPNHHAAGQALVDVDVGAGHNDQGMGQAQVIAVDHNAT